MTSPMPNSKSHRWISPNPAQKPGPKQFRIGWNSTDTIGLLDMVARALNEINGGKAWRTNRQPVRRPDVHPGALELSSIAAYTGPAGQPGQLDLQIVVQPHTSIPQIELRLTFMDYYGQGVAWMEPISESVVAQTMIHIDSSLLAQVGEVATGYPCQHWMMLQGAWRNRAFLQHGPWWIELA